MDLSRLVPAIDQALNLAAVRSRIEDVGTALTVGVSDAAKPASVAALASGITGPLLVIVPRAPAASDLAEELRAWFGDSVPVWVCPERDTFPFEPTPPDSAAIRERLRSVQALANGERCAIVACGIAVAQRTLAPGPDGEGAVAARTGARSRPDDFVAQLLRLGYRTVPLVEQAGDVARRGGIVDVFPSTDELPVRIEFFGDGIESIRRFSVATQRSIEKLDAALLAPAVEVANMRHAIARLSGRLDLGTARPEVRERFEEEIARIREGDSIPGQDFYVPFLAEGSLLDHLPGRGLLVVDEMAQLAEVLSEYDEQTEEARRDLESRGEIPGGLPAPHEAWESLRARLDGYAIQLRLSRWAVGDEGSPADSADVVRLPFVAPDAYGGRLRAVAEDLAEARSAGDAVVVVSQQSQRLAEVLAEEGVPATLDDTAPAPARGSLTLVHGSLTQGWRLPSAMPLRVLSDTELFGFRKQRRRIAPQQEGARETFLAQVSEGDIVVHIDHGVARFAGLVHRRADGIEREYLDLRFASGDRLYVPAHQVDRVTRYVGPSDRPPTLSRLGSQEWPRAKERVRRAVADLARELLDLYATREVLEGRPFPEDTAWQQELEGSFPYVETPDQVEAMRAIKHDMERPRPMDRLVCGDVGYGKTELAVRAAFKAVVDGAQVAVLVPTTVLAQQHLTTFRERLSGFPVTVDMLSRFRSDAEQRQIVDKLAAGSIDIVIGTHRLLQKDINFKDLGLVIIDEEQRFGVGHKERLKQMRKEVDVLTLTATPIPRTIHMALSRIRDLSMMETPPEARLPIKTYVAEVDDHLVREAILRELERGGQVFFVHNRVHDIERVAARVRDVAPEAVVGIAHGQQPEIVLERAMLDFVEGRTDVLVCTTIIESGLDIPNANTLIVDKADKLGLAQLYQLRGRVGRGAARAYAYLLFDGYRALSEPAQKRLQAIFEATDLGAGFQIALRDLEIRGAGNLLGAEQSGNIGVVGFDLYVRLLGDAVERLKALREGRAAAPPTAQPPSIAIDLPLSAHLPAAYVPDLNLRLALYQQMAEVTDEREVAQLRVELCDRFGPLPPAAEHLLYIVQVRALAGAAAVAAIQVDAEDVVIRFRPGVSPRELLGPRVANTLRVGPTQIRLSLTEGWEDHLLDTLGAVAKSSMRKEAQPEAAILP